MRLENSNAKSRRAFTLMEMVVVVVVIGIISAMIIPEMKGTFDDALLRSTSRDLMNAFSLASSRAVSFNQSCRVQLDPQNGRYLVERQTRDGGREDFVPLKDVSGAEGKLDSRIAVEVRQSGEDSPENSQENNSDARAVEQAPPDAVSFYSDGTADAAEIHLRDRAGFQLVLLLNPVTARVQIIEPQHE
jgi:prepilin-type N-terminal cleavage/methylation domain-containing protein